MVVTIDSTEGRPWRVRVTTDQGATVDFMPSNAAYRQMGQAFSNGYNAGLADRANPQGSDE